MIFASILISVALVERLWFDMGPNVELVTMASVLVGMYRTRWIRIVVPISIMFISDMFLGWGLISLFTWSGFLFAAFIPQLGKRFIQEKFTLGLSSGFVAVLLFYIWTNFGVWATDQWGMYANDLHGLMLAYINAIPFLKMQMVSAAIFIPIGIGAYELGTLANRRVIDFTEKDKLVTGLLHAKKIQP